MLKILKSLTPKPHFSLAYEHLPYNPGHFSLNLPNLLPNLYICVQKGDIEDRDAYLESSLV